MFGYCSGYNEELADIGPERGSALTATLLKCGPGPYKYPHTALTFVFCSLPLKAIAVMDACPVLQFR